MCSPDGKLVAVATHDNAIDIYKLQPRLERVGTCSGHSSYITHIDFSADGRWLQR